MLLNVLRRWKSIGHSVFDEKYSHLEIHNLNNDNVVPTGNYHFIQNNDLQNVNSDFIDDQQFSENINDNYDSPINLTEDSSNDLKNHKCNNCSNFYFTNKNLQAHQKYCVKQSDSLTNDIKQNKIKLKGRKSLRTFVCEVCNEKFNKVSIIIDHYVKAHMYNQKSIKPYTCDKCEHKFSTLSLLHQHLKYHDKDRSKMCPTCGKSFITSNDLISHQYTHFNRRNYKCNDCSKAFNTNKNLRTHILVVHTDKSLWRYHCTVCDKRFPQKSNFDQHSRRHTGDKPYICHICQKPFISRSELKRHIQLHSNIKLFKCDPCGTEYKTKRSYSQHFERKHSDATMKKDKKYTCHICPSTFFEKAKLLRHLSRHSGSKPYSCSLCEKNFSDKAYLKQHIRVIHKSNETVEMNS